MKVLKMMKVAVVITAVCFGNQALAADTSIATLQLSGSVPTVFSVTARGLPGDLDLTPGVIVNDRLIGIIHYKFNVSAASITFASSTASGGPEGASAYTFSTPFTVETIGCSAHSGALAGNIDFPGGMTLSIAGSDQKSPAAGALVGNGIETECQLVASWGGTASTLPLGGVFSMNITITMVSI